MSLIYNRKDLHSFEIEVFSTINFNFNLISPYEYIRSFIYDFIYNNEKQINSLNIRNHIENLEKASIYMAKLMLHKESFSKFP